MRVTFLLSPCDQAAAQTLLGCLQEESGDGTGADEHAGGVEAVGGTGEGGDAGAGGGDTEKEVSTMIRYR